MATLLVYALQATAQPIRVGSKAFTEGVILGEVVTGLFASAGYEVTHRAGLGGTTFAWNALLAGELDAYPDYSGTLIQEVLAGDAISGLAELEQVLATHGVRMAPPLGFNNTYAIGMRADRAEALGVRTLSELRRHPELVGGFSTEFMNRSDGWPGLRDAYDLPQANVRGLDHDLAYRGLESGDIDFTDLYSTDAEIAYYGLNTLIDDAGFFPEYEAVVLYRADLVDRVPDVDALLARLAGRIDEAAMTGMNARAKLDRVPENQVAADFLNAEILDEPAVTTAAETRTRRILRYTGEHLRLVLFALIPAILAAIPLGIAAARKPRLGAVILAVVGMIYTIPSLALLVFMIPLLGIGGPPAMVALFLYSLLPIVRNTHAGLLDIPAPLRESAEALGLSPAATLRQIELPLASRAILAGVKTSSVITIGTATLGALIGAGGYGQPILTGIRLDDVGLILEGAIPAAVLALVAQALFAVAERWIVPRGLRPR
ncbi:MAG: glycine betaine ABC transporter substrate-binding protein [Rhodothermales bacterium]|nr:glycine betaine ABC transporter substrate-binding protein [Rhodothermales bacterium]